LFEFGGDGNCRPDYLIQGQIVVTATLSMISSGTEIGRSETVQAEESVSL